MLKLRGLGVVGILAGLAALGAQPAHAQTVSVAPITMTGGPVPPPPINLTTLGPDGWIKWGSTNPNSGNYLSTTGQTFTTTASGIGTTPAFDNSPGGNNNVSFTWTNGNLGNNSQTLGLLYENPGAGGNSLGTQFTVSVPTVGPTGKVQFYVADLGDATSLTAQLKDGSGTVLNSQTDNSLDAPVDPINGQTFDTGYFAVNYSGAASGDTLLLTYTATQDHGAGTVIGPGYIGIQAA